MRNMLKLLCALTIFITAALTYFWPTIKMMLAENSHYTELDKREYDFYTPDILKKIPRITSRYDFDYVKISGPASHIYAVHFYDTVDTSKIDTYLTSTGYRRQNKCHIEAACWRGKDPQEVVTVSILEDPAAVLVAVIYKF